MNEQQKAEKIELLKKLIITIINHDDPGSNNLVKTFSLNRTLNNAICYECMVYKIYLLALHTGRRPREGTPQIVIDSAAHSVADMFGNTPAYWNAKILSDVESYLTDVTNNDRAAGKIIENLAGAAGDETLTIDLNMLRSAKANTEIVAKFMDGVLIDFYKNSARIEFGGGSAKKAAASGGSGCLISVVGLIAIFALGCFVF